MRSNYPAKCLSRKARFLLDFVLSRDSKRDTDARKQVFPTRSTTLEVQRLLEVSEGIDRRAVSPARQTRALNAPLDTDSEYPEPFPVVVDSAVRAPYKKA